MSFATFIASLNSTIGFSDPGTTLNPIFFANFFASNLPPEESEVISAYASHILSRARLTVKSIRNAGELKSVSIETATRELLITPDQDMPLIFAVLRKLK